MKLNMLWEVKLNEVEGFCITSMLMGGAMFLLGAFWDNIAGCSIGHNEGLGWMQVSWMAFWGLYTFWAAFLVNRWGER